MPAPRAASRRTSSSTVWSACLTSGRPNFWAPFLPGDDRSRVSRDGTPRRRSAGGRTLSPPSFARTVTGGLLLYGSCRSSFRRPLPGNESAMQERLAVQGLPFLHQAGVLFHVFPCSRVFDVAPLRHHDVHVVVRHGRPHLGPLEPG